MAKYANRYLYTDVEPFEVVSERSQHKYYVRPMKALDDPEWKPDEVVIGNKRKVFNDHDRKWRLEPATNEESFSIRQHKDGIWYDKTGNRYFIDDQPKKFVDSNM